MAGMAVGEWEWVLIPILRGGRGMTLGMDARSSFSASFRLRGSIITLIADGFGISRDERLSRKRWDALQKMRGKSHTATEMSPAVPTSDPKLLNSRSSMSLSVT